MAKTAAPLVNLVIETRDAIAALDRRFDELRAELDSVVEERSVLRQEESVFVSRLHREFPDAQIPDVGVDEDPRADDDQPILFSYEIATDDWQYEKRNVVILRALEMLTGDGKYASSIEVQEILKSKNREMNRDNIGAGLSYLASTGKVRQRSRGEWAINPKD
jgi:hypothetical protein